MGIIVMLKDVRLSFPKLDEPEYFQGTKSRPDEKPRWSAAFHVGAQSTAYKTDANGKPLEAPGPAKARIDALLKETAAAQWPLKFESILANILPDPKGCCWIDGARKESPGVWILSSHRSSDKGRPVVLDNDKSPIYKATNEVYPEKAGRIYSGMYVNAHIELWAQDNKSGKGLRAGLLGIQRLRDGDAFGGGHAPVADAFAEVSDGKDADDLS